MLTIQTSSHSELQSVFWTELLHSIMALSAREEIYIGLSGGSSLDIFYKKISENLHSIDLDIRSRLRFCLLDERIVAEDHPDSNLGQLRAKFLTQLIESHHIKQDQIIAIDPNVSDIAGEYSHRVPRIDIALVGVGPDGHIASLFPHHPLLDSTESGYLEIIDSPKPPAHRITVSPEMLTSAPYAFVAFMRGKELAYSQFLDLVISVADCPVKMLTSCEHLIVMSDIDE